MEYDKLWLWVHIKCLLILFKSKWGTARSGKQKEGPNNLVRVKLSPILFKVPGCLSLRPYSQVIVRFNISIMVYFLTVLGFPAVLNLALCLFQGSLHWIADNFEEGKSGNVVQTTKIHFEIKADWFLVNLASNSRYACIWV
jgi:hypothetical protein